MCRFLKSKWLWIAVAVLICVAAVLIGVLFWRDRVATQPTQGGTTAGDTVTTTVGSDDLATTATAVSEQSTTESVTDTTAATVDTVTATDTASAPSTTVTTTRPTTTRAPKKELTVTSHKKTSTTTNESFTVFAGSSDPDYPLLLNGKEVSRDKYGSFSVEKELSAGKNTFTFSHKGKEVTYTVKYDYVVMRSYSPDGNRRYESGAKFSVVVSARAGSTVTATFQKQTITLKPIATKDEEGTQTQTDTFVEYSGSFTLPDDNVKDVNLGKITFAATHGKMKDTASSGTITCKKAATAVIGEIVTFTAETFDGDKSDDDSRPTNNYLPKGTVDYVVGHSYFGDKEYLNLRCGKRVYVEKKVSPTTNIVKVAKEYAGRLPSTNQVTVNKTQVTGDATYMTLDVAWKAPFLLDLLPQKYTNPKTQDYSVDEVTCEYVQITFCYADSLKGVPTFADNHPLFTHATVTDSDEGKVLRLYLRRKGGFYGWDAYYNDAGQLVFYFLHPAQVTASNNAYGADLTGVTILLDVGHGAKSEGAFGLDEDHPEGERNYNLAMLIKDELESVGATVVLNRTADGDLDADQRCRVLKNLKPDLCIAIHHDSNVSSKPNGFGAFHSTLFSAEPARMIYEATMAAKIYDADAKNNRNRYEWHYYFVARMSDCPVVLTENGFMSSPLDHAGIVDHDTNVRKAKAIAKGTVQYFLSLRIPGLKPTITTTTTTTTTKTTTTATTTTVVTPPTQAETTATQVTLPTTATTTTTTTVVTDTSTESTDDATTTQPTTETETPTTEPTSSSATSTTETTAESTTSAATTMEDVTTADTTDTSALPTEATTVPTAETEATENNQETTSTAMQE